MKHLPKLTFVTMTAKADKLFILPDGEYSFAGLHKI